LSIQKELFQPVRVLKRQSTFVPGVFIEMPVLDKESTAYPADLFQKVGRNVAAAPGQWWVLRTKPRQEKAVARELLQRTLPFFLPTTRRVRTGRRGETASYLPLFPSYVFSYVTDEERFEINRTGRLASFVAVPDQEKIWQELGNLHELLDRGLDVHPVLKITAGSKVTIRTGPLKNITGSVVRQSGRCKFVVEIDFLQAGAAVEIDEADLEPSQTN
jgi:transcription antitermination factor NusG